MIKKKTSIDKEVHNTINLIIMLYQSRARKLKKDNADKGLKYLFVNFFLMNIKV